MAIIQFKQGEDKKIPLTILENGVAKDVYDSLNIKVLLKIGDLVVAKYSNVVESGYGVCEAPDTSPYNIINVLVERSESKGFPTGKLYAIVLVAYTNGDFGDSTEVREFSIQIGSVLKGEGIEEIIP